jgi:hypothetical protein
LCRAPRSLAEAVKAAQGAVGKGDVAGDVSAFAEAFQRGPDRSSQSQLKYIDQFQTEFSNSSSGISPNSGW